MHTTDTLAPSRRRRRADASHNDECLLTAAAAAFTEHGPNASLDDIARRAGVGIGTLYRHFPTRQALVEAVYRSNIDALSAEAEGQLGARDPDDALAAWLRSVLVHNLKQRCLKEALMNDYASEVHASCKPRMLAAGAALLARAQRAGAVRPDLAISELLRLVYGIALATEKAPDSAGEAERLLEVVLDGLRRQSAERAAG